MSTPIRKLSLEDLSKINERIERFNALPKETQNFLEIQYLTSNVYASVVMLKTHDDLVSQLGKENVTAELAYTVTLCCFLNGVLNSIETQDVLDKQRKSDADDLEKWKI